MRSESLIFGLSMTLTLGCGAVKSTYHLTQAEQAVRLAQGAEAIDYAPYEWTMTSEYIIKAREEWGNSAFGEAESLAKKAAEWAERAEEAAAKGQRYEQTKGVHDLVPEEVEVVQPDPDDDFLMPKDRLEIIDIEEEEE